MLDGWDGLGGLACIHLKNFHPVSLSWVIAVQSEVVGRVGQTAAATCGTHTVYKACQPRWSSCFHIGLTTTLSLCQGHSNWAK